MGKNMRSKNRKFISFLLAIGLSASVLSGCGGFGMYSSGNASTDAESAEEAIVEAANTEKVDSQEEVPDSVNEKAADEQSEIEETKVSAEGSEETENVDTEQEESEPVEESTPEEYISGYATEEEFRNRHTGSASYITDKTLIVSIFVDEEEDVWSPEEKDTMFRVCDIAYSFLETYLKEQYDANVELLYDWKNNPDLVYSIRIFEDIPAYVTTEQERHMDELEDEWVAQVPVRELMQKYETESIAFLYFVPHEGCSYSSMHFVEDDADTWNEGCLLYLQDMYSTTYEYETPTVFAHELLHLFGAEDYYSSAEVFSAETYSELSRLCADDIMLHTFDKINGKYTTYPDEVHGEITPVTAYLIGIYDDSAIETMPELIREEKAVFPGSTYDRPF